MTEQEKDFWALAQKRILKEVSRQNYDTWFRPVRIAVIKDDSVVLAVPNKFFKQWLLDHYMDLLARILSEVLEREEVSIAFQIMKDENGEETGEVMDEEPSAEAAPEEASVPEPPRQKTKPHGLNPKYTFSTFVVGPSNQFAHAAALAVAENPGRAYNPLFIYGGVGLGKTHLLSAICGFMKERSPKTKITYMTSEEFTNELINSIHYNRMTEFRNKYRNTDVLAIDDIQFIAGKERTQEEFFHTFNTLHEYSKQIVLSSDRFPKDMPDMEERLRSRFEWGLIADIQAPDLETKAAIVERKARQEGIELPQDVAMFLANNIKSNVRELEGSLIRLGAYASLTGREINMELAKGVLRDIITEKTKVMSTDEIIRLIADRHQIKVAEIKSKKRTQRLVQPRQLAMYLCRTVAGNSLPEVGKAFGGKDHTTVMHACRQVEEKRQNDLKFDAEVENLIKQVKG
ncbi:MAG: chromosomal replication initiator protein DnaA [Nitrospirae bacterium]|nr:chromosomal replication initiator protein DnaA [Nitrospirota bacterium]